MPIYQVYSVNGRLMHETTDEEVAKLGLAIWPKAWTLVRDGKAIEVNPRPKPAPDDELTPDQIRTHNRVMQGELAKKLVTHPPRSRA